MKQKSICSFILLVLVFLCHKLSSQNLHELAKEGNTDVLKNLISTNTSIIDTADGGGYTLLHWSLIRQKWDLVRFLIDQGANVNLQGTEGGSPMHCAANHENIEIIDLLIKKGAQIDMKNLWGNTPLSLASQRGCNKTVQFLISKGADILAKSNEGWTPLHYAYKCGHKEVQNLLIQAGASDTIKDLFGKIPSDYRFERPHQVSATPDYLNEFIGIYNVGGNAIIRVFISENKLMLEEYAIDELYLIAPDQFYDYREPWKVRFFRNIDGKVDKIAVDFQRQTIVGKKVSLKDEVVEKPRLGIKVRPIQINDISDETLKRLFFDEKANANAQIVTFAQEGSVSKKAGLQEKDIILEFNNVKLNEPGDLFQLLYDIKPNSVVPIKIIRNSEIYYLNIIL